MQPNKLAIIAAFYLSKFDKEGLKNLGYKTDSEAFQKIGNAVGVKKNYIKFRRDEFDPIHPWRKGWLRPMDKRILSAIEALQDIDEPTLRQIVLNILNKAEYRDGDEVQMITALFADEKSKKGSKGKYILRGPTGKLAEEYFIKYYSEKKLPFPGQLIDTREMGCGYDFEIISDGKKYMIEIKGLSEVSGGILFTDKEWNTALKAGDNYFLVIIRSLGNTPEVTIIRNPSASINPQKRIYRTIQTHWTVSDTELRNF
jgi:hypothetical protein